jgi:hypothetical protein
MGDRSAVFFNCHGVIDAADVAVVSWPGGIPVRCPGRDALLCERLARCRRPAEGPARGVHGAGRGQQRRIRRHPPWFGEYLWRRITIMIGGECASADVQAPRRAGEGTELMNTPAIQAVDVAGRALSGMIILQLGRALIKKGLMTNREVAEICSLIADDVRTATEESSSEANGEEIARNCEMWAEYFMNS